MRYLLLLFLITIISRAPGQDLRALEKDLQQTTLSDLKAIRRKTAAIYSLDPFNEMATFALTTSYKLTKNEDSIPRLFQILKSNNPRSPLPYLLSAKYQCAPISVSDSSGLQELKTALTLDSNCIEAHYLAGISYYHLFNRMSTNYYAASSRFHLEKAVRADTSRRIMLRYPILQLSGFLQDQSFVTVFEDQAVIIPPTDSLNIPKKGWYFPFDKFLQPDTAWMADYSYDILSAADDAAFSLNWYSDQLRALKEPLLLNRPYKTVYRFTWLRSFHKPVAIRIEKKGDTCVVTWKQSSGAGGYEPGQLTVSGSAIISEEQWNGFVALLQASHFWNMPTISKTPSGFDGARWIIEGMEDHRYHVVDRWSARDTDFGKCGQYLIRLTTLKIKDRELY